MILALLAAAIVPGGESFSCTPTAVWDGDGPIWCAEGPRVRISGIAAREMDGTCRDNQPCPAASAEQARGALVELLGGSKGALATGHISVVAKAMSCVSAGGAGGSRTAAWCTLSSGRDLSCAMMETDTVLKWQRYWRSHTCE